MHLYMNFRIKVIFHYVRLRVLGTTATTQTSSEMGVAVCRSGHWQSIKLLMHD